MNISKCFLITVATGLLLTISTMTSAKTDPKQIYAYGFAASFNDSTVYLTDIQLIDSAWVSSKNQFLSNREDYSYQLRNYLATKGENNRTCIISYAFKRKDIEKKYIKLRNKYIGKNNFNVKYINENEFKFKAVAPIEITETAPSDEQSAKKDNKPKGKMNKGRKGPGKPNRL